jgi:hypothetical protein
MLVLMGIGMNMAPGPGADRRRHGLGAQLLGHAAAGPEPGGRCGQLSAAGRALLHPGRRADERGGISRRIIDMAQAWVGHIRGGLGYVAIGAAVLMASMSGSALADTAALATILLPMMRQQGYPMATSAG